MSDGVRISAIVLVLFSVALSLYSALERQPVNFKIHILIEYESKHSMD
jgi:hypothetical protein